MKAYFRLPRKQLWLLPLILIPWLVYLTTIFVGYDILTPAVSNAQTTSTIPVEITSPIYEKTTARIKLYFYDYDGVPTAPLTLTYKINNEKDGYNLLASTTIVPSSSTVTIVVPAAANKIVDDKENYENELHTMTLQWTYAGGESRGKVTFPVRNLKFENS